MRVLIAMLSLPLLSACAPLALLPAPVTLTARDVAPVANAIVDIVGRRLPPGQGALHLDAPVDEMGRAIAARVFQALKAKGYAVEDTPRASHRISFTIMPLKEGALLSVTIDGGVAAALLSRDTAGTLASASGLSFREDAQ